MTKRKPGRPKGSRNKPKTPTAIPATGFVRIGRKTSLTPELQREICSKIATGDSLRDAALTSGVDEDTFHEWIRRGNGTDSDRAQTPLHAEFAEAVRQAEAARRRLWKGLIRRAAVGTPKKGGDWQATKYLGSVTDPKEFVPQVRVHLEGEFDSAARRIEEAFKDDPVGLEKALRAIVGGPAANADQVEPRHPEELETEP